MRGNELGSVLDHVRAPLERLIDMIVEARENIAGEAGVEGSQHFGAELGGLFDPLMGA